MNLTNDSLVDFIDGKVEIKNYPKKKAVIGIAKNLKIDSFGVKISLSKAKECKDYFATPLKWVPLKKNYLHNVDLGLSSNISDKKKILLEAEYEYITIDLPKRISLRILLRRKIKRLFLFFQN